MTTFAILPVKRFTQAKQRLAEAYGKGTRRALVEAMVTDVLVALRRSQRVEHALVVTTEPAAEAIAHGYDAESLSDRGTDGHSAAAERGVQEALERGATRALLVAGDCPALDPREVDALLDRYAATPGRLVVVVPDRHGTGTNALLLSPPDVIAPAFGPGSRERHEQLARAAGADVVVEEVPSLILDVDTAEDLDALREWLVSGHGNAAHTRGMLSRLAKR